MRIVEASEREYDHVMQVEHDAFASDEEPGLVADLLRDPTAQPSLSLLAYEEARPIGHVLFTRTRLLGAPDRVSSAILAPLAVIPAFQRRGVGQALVEHGARRLAASGVQLLFVLGHTDYYPRCGFEPAIPHGLLAPYPIVPEAWMVRALAPGLLGSFRGKVACATSLGKPEYWVE